MDPNETETVPVVPNALPPKPMAVSDFGFFCDQNWKHRRKMEDAHYLEDNFNGKNYQAFFGVYDGHGGKEAAVFASKNFHLVPSKYEVFHEQLVIGPCRILK